MNSPVQKSDDVLIATVPKNTREEIRISRCRYAGHDLANVRVWYRAEDGTMHPAKQGLAFRLGQLSAIIDGLEKLHSDARSKGLVG
jgi:hypothetical protein